MVDRQARDLEIRARIPVQVKIFLLKFMKYISKQFAVMYVKMMGVKNDFGEKIAAAVKFIVQSPDVRYRGGTQ